MITEKEIKKLQETIVIAFDEALRKEGKKKIFLAFEELRKLLTELLGDKPGNNSLTKAIDRLEGKKVLDHDTINRRTVYYLTELTKCYLDAKS